MTPAGVDSSSFPPCTRVDRTLGIRETVAWFGGGPHRLIGARYEPVRATGSAGVVMCPSICNDFLHNYSREVKLARSLAAAGVAVHHFHYRGTGNSDGDGADVTFSSMVEDTAAATEELRTAAGVDRVGFVGTRFGGPIAAAAANAVPGAPVALVDPVAEASGFFREAWRAALITDLGKEARTRSVDGLMADLAGSGRVDVLGHEVHRTLVDSSADRSVVGELTDPHRPVLLAHFGETLTGGLDRLAGQLRGRGATVDVELLGARSTWWALEEDGVAPPPDKFVPALTTWLASKLAVG